MDRDSVTRSLCRQRAPKRSRLRCGTYVAPKRRLRARKRRVAAWSISGVSLARKCYRVISPSHQAGSAMQDPSARIIHGSCRCGNIRFTLDWATAQPAIASRACGCTFCTKHGAAWTSNPQGQFRLHIADATKARRHQFGTGTADFHVCSTCGVVPIVTCGIEGRRYAVVNVNTFDDVHRSELVTSPADFEGETPENRLARRRRNWTPEADARDG